MPAAAVLLGVLLASTAEATDPTEHVEQAFHRAQVRLAAQGYDLSRVDELKLRSVINTARGRRGVTCNGRPAVGCFKVIFVPLLGGEVREYGRLEYDSRDNQVIRKILDHEAVHALRWAAGDPAWAVHDTRFPH